MLLKRRPSKATNILTNYQIANMFFSLIVGQQVIKKSRRQLTNVFIAAQSKIKMKITEQQELMFAGKICPYCKQPSKYVDSSEIYGNGKSYGMMYLCKDCKAWVGTHKDEPTKALGRLADKHLRTWKIKAHERFNLIYELNYKTRGNAYKWLSERLGIPQKYTNIGFFNIKTCQRVVNECNIFYDNYYKNK